MNALNHATKYARIRAPRASPTRLPLTFWGHFPTNGIPGYRSEMQNEPEIVAANVAALMKYATEHIGHGPASKKALAKETDKLRPDGSVVRSTVQRVLKGDTAVQCDKLGAIAEAYGMQAWQLLVPDLDPEHPPRVLTKADEARIATWKSGHDMWVASNAMAEAKKHGVRTGSGLRAGSPAAGAHPSKKPPSKRSRA